MIALDDVLQNIAMDRLATPKTQKKQSTGKKIKLEKPSKAT